MSFSISHMTLAKNIHSPVSTSSTQTPPPIPDHCVNCFWQASSVLNSSSALEGVFFTDSPRFLRCSSQCLIFFVRLPHLNFVMKSSVPSSHFFIWFFAFLKHSKNCINVPLKFNIFKHITRWFLHLNLHFLYLNIHAMWLLSC